MYGGIMCGGGRLGMGRGLRNDRAYFFKELCMEEEGLEYSLGSTAFNLPRSPYGRVCRVRYPAIVFPQFSGIQKTKREFKMIYNLTPHSIDIYPEDAFVNLIQKNPTTWVADSVDKVLRKVYDSHGTARIAVFTEPCEAIDGVPSVFTVYGDALGIPANIQPEDVLIVSLPMQSMAKASGHPLSSQMVCPYKVVRLAANGSVVLGCMGFTR
jgi:hypothetical protein